MCTQAGEHYEAAFSGLSIAVQCQERLAQAIMLIQCLAFESTEGSRQSSRWAFELSREFCTAHVLLGLGNLSTLGFPHFTDFYCAQALILEYIWN